MRAKIALPIWVVLFVCAWGYAADFASEWEELTSRSLYLEFADKNQARIVNLTNIDALERSEILGLEVSGASLADWSTLGSRFTNVVYLRITSSATDLPATFFSAITNYPRLEYLHLQCREALAVPPYVNLLTNLPHLKYLGIDVPSASDIAGGIYQIGTLKELFLVVGAVNLPDGVAKLPELMRIEIHGKRATPVRSLPADFPKCRIQRLAVANMPGVEKLLPVLPPDLIELSVLKCQLRAIPAPWLRMQKLRLIDLSNNELARFPSDLLGLMTLKLVGLDLNRITAVPPLGVAGNRQLKISLVANPIRHFAPENELLLQRGIIEK